MQNLELVNFQTSDDVSFKAEELLFTGNTCLVFNSTPVITATSNSSISIHFDVPVTFNNGATITAFNSDGIGILFSKPLLVSGGYFSVDPARGSNGIEFRDSITFTNCSARIRAIYGMVSDEYMDNSNEVFGVKVLGNIVISGSDITILASTDSSTGNIARDLGIQMEDMTLTCDHSCEFTLDSSGQLVREIRGVSLISVHVEGDFDTFKINFGDPTVLIHSQSAPIVGVEIDNCHLRTSNVSVALRTMTQGSITGVRIANQVELENTRISSNIMAINSSASITGIIFAVSTSCTGGKLDHGRIKP